MTQAPPPIPHPSFPAGRVEGRQAGLPARAAISLLRLYQRTFSNLKPRVCRFYPSCSEYAAQAIAHCGLLRGLALAAWRLLRCNPFSPGGYDPGPWSHQATERHP
jgi:hypothetical protein